VQVIDIYCFYFVKSRVQGLAHLKCAGKNLTIRHMIALAENDNTNQPGCLQLAENMKIKVSIAAILLAVVSASASAASDRNYYVVDATVKQRFDVYNDGKNTYIEAIPGLVVKGATVDGNNYIVYGVPTSIAAQLNGRDITLTRGVPPKPDAATTLISRAPGAGSGLPVADRGMGSRTVKAMDAKSTPDTPESPQATTVRNWSIKPSHLSLHQLMEDWGSKVGFEVIFKTRDFPLNVRSEMVVSTGDFWAALTLLGESYRNSDAPFQIQPTDFKQIVVTPMNAPKASVPQTNFEVLN
jgi:hypothetical protein